MYISSNFHSKFQSEWGQHFCWAVVVSLSTTVLEHQWWTRSMPGATFYTQNSEHMTSIQSTCLDGHAWVVSLAHMVRQLGCLLSAPGLVTPCLGFVPGEVPCTNSSGALYWPVWPQQATLCVPLRKCPHATNGMCDAGCPPLLLRPQQWHAQEEARCPQSGDNLRDQLFQSLLLPIQ